MGRVEGAGGGGGVIRERGRGESEKLIYRHQKQASGKFRSISVQFTLKTISCDIRILFCSDSRC